jgi:hypothetical protein
MNHPKIIKHRISKPLKELLRKRNKALRKGTYTQEDLDYSYVWGNEMHDFFNNQRPSPPHFSSAVDKMFWELSE